MDYSKYINYDSSKLYSDKQTFCLDLVFHNVRYYNENNNTEFKVTLDKDEFSFEQTNDVLLDYMIYTICRFSKGEVTEDNAYGDIITKLSIIINNTVNKSSLKQKLSFFTFYLGNSERTRKFKGEVATFL